MFIVRKIPNNIDRVKKDKSHLLCTDVNQSPKTGIFNISEDKNQTNFWFWWIYWYAEIYTRFVCVVVADDVAVVVAGESGVADVAGSGKFVVVKV